MAYLRCFVHVAMFELRYRTRGPLFLTLLLAMLLVGGLIAYVTASGEVADTAPQFLSRGYVVTYAFLSVLLASIFPISIIANEIVRRDHDVLIADIVQSSPMPGWLVYLARYAAQSVLALMVIVAGAIGYESGCRMPWIAPGLAGPIPWPAWFSGFVVLAIPDLIAVSAMAMFAAVMTSNRLVQWTVPFLIASFSPFSVIAIGKGFSVLGQLLDPLGSVAVLVQTYGLTSAEQHHWRVTLTGAVLQNRTLWLSIALGCLIGGAALSSGAQRTVWLRARLLGLLRTFMRPFLAPRKAKLASEGTQVEWVGDTKLHRLRAPSGSVSGFAIFRARTLFELQGLTRSFLTLLFIALPTIAVVPVLAFGTASEGDTQVLLPVSAVLIPKLQEAVALGAAIFVLLVAGEMMWRERQARMHELTDSIAIPPFTVLGGKLAALAIVTAAQLLVVCIIGIAWQILHASPQINLGHYLARFFLLDWPALCIVAALTMFVHALIPHRGPAHLAAIGLVALLGSLEDLGVEHRLLTFGTPPKLELSDMNGVGHYLVPALLFTIYWIFVAAALFILADLVRDRGFNVSLRDRLRQVRTGPQVSLNALMVFIAGGCLLGSYIFWNTNIRNDYVNSATQRQKLIAYERAFGNFVTQPQPRIAGLDVVLDLFPVRRRFRVKGDITLRNPSSEPISRFYVEAVTDHFKLNVTDAASIKRPFPSCCDVYEVVLKSPLPPGDVIKLSFEGEEDADGLLNGDSLSVRENGTRLDALDVLPLIGVHHRRFLTDAAAREKAGLPKLKDAPGGSGSRYQAYYSLDTDQARFAITVSTSGDQTAVAAGRLVRQWSDSGRNYFRYEIDGPVDSNWVVTSARYATATRDWRGIPLYVHYHPAHARNVDQMLQGMESGLEYCSRAFSPYQYKELRLVEFPYSGSAAATAQPGLILYSEMAGFIADTQNDGADELRIAHTTSHEVAHQWWGYQISPANLPGAKFLVEALAEYTAIMIMRERLGDGVAQRSVSRYVDRYLKARKDFREEQPLVALEDGAHESVYYGKGTAALYALVEQVGESRLNQVLAAFVKAYAGAHNPYPTAGDLVDLLKRELGVTYHDLITDLFERITLWSFELGHAKSEPLPDGRWRTTIGLKAGKAVADAKGAETEQLLDQRVPISVYERDPVGISRFETVLARVRSGSQRVSIITKTEPKFVRINASRALVQRSTSKTTLPVTR